MTDYEKSLQKELEKWQNATPNLLNVTFDWLMKPVDWLSTQILPEATLNSMADALQSGLSVLNDASEMTYSEGAILKKAKEFGIEATSIADLSNQPIDKLDELARPYLSENTLLATLQGAGTGLGGAALIAADIPLLFTINFRQIQQIAACYGISVKGKNFEPLVLAVLDVAASGSSEAKKHAVKEASVAALALANDIPYKGKKGKTAETQSRNLPREIAKNLASYKLGQMIPLAGSVIGAGVNYWFTANCAEAAFMLFRFLYLERKERA